MKKIEPNSSTSNKITKVILGCKGGSDQQNRDAVFNPNIPGFTAQSKISSGVGTTDFIWDHYSTNDHAGPVSPL